MKKIVKTPKATRQAHRAAAQGVGLLTRCLSYVEQRSTKNATALLRGGADTCRNAKKRKQENNHSKTQKSQQKYLPLLRDFIEFCSLFHLSWTDLCGLDEAVVRRIHLLFWQRVPIVRGTLLVDAMEFVLNQVAGAHFWDLEDAGPWPGRRLRWKMRHQMPWWRGEMRRTQTNPNSCGNRIMARRRNLEKSPRHARQGAKTQAQPLRVQHEHVSFW